MIRQSASIAMIVLCLTARAWAGPTTQPDVTAADLVRSVRAGEAWIEHVQSISFRLESVWTMTPEAIALRKAELHKQFPEARIDETTFPELRPRETEVNEIAFDAKRFRYYADRPGDMARLIIWDGSRGMGRERYFASMQDQFWFNKELGESGDMLLAEGAWPRAQHHWMWFDPGTPKDREDAARMRAKPEDFDITGREIFHGEDCWVLNRRGYNAERWWVGVADHQLHGTGFVVLDGNPHANEVAQAVAAEHGKRIENASGFEEWIKTLPKDEGDRIDSEFCTKCHVTDHLGMIDWMLDFKPVAPDCLMPMTQGYDLLDGTYDKPITTTHREIRVSDVKVNQPLPDEMFKMQLEEGVQVFDRTQDPPLIYKYKKDMTPQEWDRIKQEAMDRKQKELARQAVQDSALNKPAPAFPNGQWLNSKPLKWADFTGKPVIVDFWAEWCGPCRNDLPAMVSLHQDREKNGFTVIAIHPPGSDLAKINQVMKEFGITYPVFIDVPPPPGAKTWGTLYAQFGVTAIPHTFLIDPHGTVVAHGSLGEMIPKARELAGKEPKN